MNRVPRVLAFGGEDYAQRRQVGDWSFSSEELSSRYGIKDGKIVFGVGKDDRGFFATYRELANPEHRGGYPYTFLLDPGERTWEDLQWNAIWLLCFLQGLERNPLREPNDLTAERLTELMESAVTEFRSVVHTTGWTTRDLSSDPLACAFASFDSEDDLDVLTLQDLGLDTRPTMTSVRDLQLHLPVCVRAGRGWLIGAGPKLATIVHARVVIDDGGEGGAAPGRESSRHAVESGGRLLAAWAELERSSWIHEEPLLGLRSTPMSSWEEGPAETGRKLVMLAAIQRGQVPGADLAQVFGSSTGTSSLDALTRAVALEAVMRGEGPLDREATRVVLTLRIGGGPRLAEGTLCRLHPDTTAQLLAGALVSGEGDFAELLDPLGAEVRERLLARSDVVARLPNLVKRFPKLAEAVRQVERGRDRLIQESLRSGASPEAWASVAPLVAPDRSQQEFRVLLATLCMEARLKGWEDLYLESSSGEEGAALLINRPVDELEGVFRRFAANPDPALREKCLYWLWQCLDPRRRRPPSRLARLYAEITKHEPAGRSRGFMAKLRGRFDAD